ncbi:MAG: hypothetical protein JWL77_2546 [Chthonomonadaceae bacterium]|nr:hypothetical protein [Chthonomonadaceae bacterium]
MTVFLALMVAGLTGLLVMAIPAFGRHGQVGTPHGLGAAGHSGLHLGPGHGAVHAGGAAIGQTLTAAGKAAAHSAENSASNLRFLPSPRMIFSLLAHYGAFGNVLHGALHLTPMIAGLLAIVPAGLLEKFAVTPLWNTMIASQGKPCSPLEALTLCEAEAVTPFRNGKGIVVMERDGRAVQFSAQLLPEQAHLPVEVGTRLRVEEVDVARERMTVTLL